MWHYGQYENMKLHKTAVKMWIRTSTSLSVLDELSQAIAVTEQLCSVYHMDTDGAMLNFLYHTLLLSRLHNIGILLYLIFFIFSFVVLIFPSCYLCFHPKPRSWCILLHSSSSSYTWTFVIVYSKAKSESNCKQLASDHSE